MKVGFAKEWERLEFIFDDIVIIRDLAEILLSLLEERLGLWYAILLIFSYLIKAFCTIVRRYFSGTSTTNEALSPIHSQLQHGPTYFGEMSFKESEVQ
jgi:hypothetical protein